jgi:hypothetical protein
MKLYIHLLLILFLSISPLNSQNEHKESGRPMIFGSLSMSYTASKDFDLGSYYSTKSYGAEIGYFLFPSLSLGFSYEKGKVDEYTARSKNMDYISFNAKKTFKMSDKIFVPLAISLGSGKGKDLNYGLNEQNIPEYKVTSSQLFLELGGRYLMSEHCYLELRCFQFGYINRHIDKKFPSTIKSFVFNDEEYFPLRLSIGYVFTK